ncbi:MAG: M15 family metallopeptidase [Treponema sp.]|nr:M15 family metallopeptidase [Treponema sp.]
MYRFFVASFSIFLFFSCTIKPAVITTPLEEEPEEILVENTYLSIDLTALTTALVNAGLPSNISVKIQECADDSVFINKFLAILNSDPYLWVFIDKETSLSANYAPDDLVELNNGSYVINRDDLLLRSVAAESLEEMSSAARNQGLTIVVSSAYRSYSYQEEVFARTVRQWGMRNANVASARPGHSQHQLGLAVDFGSVTIAFASTPEGRWLSANASRFGWSLSYPNGYERITGYRWECWHYRYVGREIADFIDSYFNGIQHYALKFLHEYKKLAMRNEGAVY